MLLWWQYIPTPMWEALKWVLVISAAGLWMMALAKFWLKDRTDEEEEK